jgi:hypothetical protein
LKNAINVHFSHDDVFPLTINMKRQNIGIDRMVLAAGTLKYPKID